MGYLIRLLSHPRSLPLPTVNVSAFKRETALNGFYCFIVYLTEGLAHYIYERVSTLEPF